MTEQVLPSATKTFHLSSSACTIGMVRVVAKESKANRNKVKQRKRRSESFKYMNTVSYSLFRMKNVEYIQGNELESRFLMTYLL